MLPAKGAAVRSSELLVAEGFQVNVAIMPAGEDPDTFIRREGGAAYAEKLRSSRQYLEYLLDQAAVGQDLQRDEHRREFLSRMLEVAARIPDAAARDQFADRLAHKARITEEVVRAEIKQAAAKRETSVAVLDRPAVGLDQVKAAEKGVIWALMREPAAGIAAASGELGRRRSGRAGDSADTRTGPLPAGMACRAPYRKRFSSV